MTPAEREAALDAFLVERVVTAPATCPFDPMCSGPIEHGRSATTLIGWSRRGLDPNHKWTECVCPAHGGFMHEQQRDRHWYTVGNVAVLGRSSCYEPVVYHHAECGGEVTDMTINKETGKITGTRCVALGNPNTCSAFDRFTCACGASLDLPDESELTRG